MPEGAPTAAASPRTVLLLGVGGLGPWLLERLVRHGGVTRVVVADVDGERAASAAGCALLGVQIDGGTVRVEGRAIDLRDVEATARLLDELRPDVVVQAASLLPVDRWWSIAREPGDGERLQAAGLGPWLPLQLLLPMRLMEAIGRADCAPVVVNLSYPDAVGAVLTRLGHATPLGAGNVNLLAVAVRQAVAAERNVAVDRVRVWIAAHYAHLRWAMGAGRRPDHSGVLRVEVDGREVTAELDPFALVAAAGRSIPWGAQCHALTAAGLVDVLHGSVADAPRALHMPGATGQPGGYPVRLSRDGVAIDPPAGANVADLVALQHQAQRWDGIERIADDGTVTLTDDAAAQMQALFGHRHRELTPDAVAARADELLAVLQR